MALEKVLALDSSGVIEKEIDTGGGGGTGDVVGPASSTNNGIPVFNGVTGKLLKQATNTTLENGLLNGLSGINNGAITGFKNKIHNWAMEISQRSGPFSITAFSNIMTLDRWKINNLSGQTATVEQVVDAPASYVRLVNSLKLTTTSAMASVPANSLIRLTQVVEGLDLRGLRGQSSVLSFHVKSSKTGTYCVSIRNAGTDRYLLGTFTVNAANTWELKSAIVPNVVTAGGTWDYGNGIGLEISWILAAGTDYQDTIQRVTWTTGNKLSLASQVNLFDTNGATFQITGVQLQAASVITTFEDRPPAVELGMCQRYAERTSISTLVSQAAQTSIQTYSFKVNKRTTPSLSGTAGYQNNVASSDFQDLGTSGYRHILGATAAGAAEWTGEVIASADF